MSPIHGLFGVFLAGFVGVPSLLRPFVTPVGYFISDIFPKYNCGGKRYREQYPTQPLAASRIWCFANAPELLVATCRPFPSSDNFLISQDP